MKYLNSSRAAIADQIRFAFLSYVGVCVQKSVQILLLCIFPKKKSPEAGISFFETSSKEEPLSSQSKPNDSKPSQSKPNESKPSQSKPSEDNYPSFMETGSQLPPDEMLAKLLYK